MSKEQLQALHAAIHDGDLATVRRLVAVSSLADGRDPEGRPALVVAAALGHAEIVAALLTAGADVEATTEEPEEEPPPHPEMVAAQESLEQAVAKVHTAFDSGLSMESKEVGSGLMDVLDAAIRKLKAADAAWEIPDEHGAESALIAASRCGHADVVRILLDHGAAIDIADEVAPSPLSDAAEHGHLEIVRMLIAAGANVERECLGTPLKRAAEGGHAEVVAELIAAGARVNFPEFAGETPLMAAARGGDLDTVRLLVEAGAEVNAYRFGDTALVRAAREGHQEIFDYLEPFSTPEIGSTARAELPKGLRKRQLQREEDSEDLVEAIDDGDVEYLGQLIDRGVDPDTRDESGQTPLIRACLYGKTAIAEALIEAGADPNLRSEMEGLEHGATALMMAAESPYAEDRPQLIAALVAAGADPDAQDDEQGWTALMRAVLTKGGLVDSVQALLDAGADPAIRDHEGKTALMIAEEAGNKKIVKLLRAATTERQSTFDRPSIPPCDKGGRPRPSQRPGGKARGTRNRGARKGPGRARR